MPQLCLAPAVHSGADLGLQNCHLPSLDSPKWSHCLHAMMQRPCVLLLPLECSPAALQQLPVGSSRRSPSTSLRNLCPLAVSGPEIWRPLLWMLEVKDVHSDHWEKLCELNHNMFWSTLRRGEKRSVFYQTTHAEPSYFGWLERLPKVQQEAGTVWHLNYFSYFFLVLAPICWKITTFQSGHNLGAIPGPTLSG